MPIRHATIDDIPALSALAAESPTAAHWTEAQYRSALLSEHPRRVILVAETQRSVGFAAGVEIAGEWELENIVVTRWEQRKGIGEMLLRAFLEEAREGRAEAVFLEVRESNRQAMNLYEKAGFIVTGRRPGYYHDPDEDAILYKKRLS
jgi:ribosomal-protein-alanine acetyltransferase